jgi:hypothetical protein
MALLWAQDADLTTPAGDQPPCARCGQRIQSGAPPVECPHCHGIISRLTGRVGQRRHIRLVHAGDRPVGAISLEAGRKSTEGLIHRSRSRFD